jgi:hypothetical protein
MYASTIVLCTGCERSARLQSGLRATNGLRDRDKTKVFSQCFPILNQLRCYGRLAIATDLLSVDGQIRSGRE